MKVYLINKNQVKVKVQKLLHNKSNINLIKKVLEEYGITFSTQYQNLILTNNTNEIGTYVEIVKEIEQVDFLLFKQKYSPYHLTEMSIEEEQYYNSLKELKIDIKSIKFI